VPDKFFRDWQTIIRRAVYEAILPLLGGGLWVLAAWWQRSSLLAALSGFGIGYLFVLSVQAQVLRIAKNVRDETDADEFRNSFASIQQAIAALTLREETQIDNGLPPDVPVSRDIDRALDLAPWPPGFTEADRCFNAGLYPSAAIAAAISFERELRKGAVSLGYGGTRPLSEILKRLTPYLDDHSNQDLQALVRLRNSLIHSQFQASKITKVEAQHMIEGFKRGAGYIQTFANRSR
jgi:hypothetical protein